VNHRFSCARIHSIAPVSVRLVLPDSSASTGCYRRPLLDHVVRVPRKAPRTVWSKNRSINVCNPHYSIVKDEQPMPRATTNDASITGEPLFRHDERLASAGGSAALLAHGLRQDFGTTEPSDVPSPPPLLRPVGLRRAWSRLVLLRFLAWIRSFPNQERLPPRGTPQRGALVDGAQSAF
jgi:hypothetical protein